MPASSPGEFVYFTHSYKGPVTNDTAAVTQYIEPFAAAVERGNVMGVQFHPEKSGDTGLKILRNFLAWQAMGACMLTKRIIACLDVHAGRVVKGVQFVDLVDAGDPATQAARHAREGADEIVLLDITATHEGRQTLLDTVRRTARELFVPFCVGGGIRSARDAEQVFEAGADKVSINSAALADPTLISAIGASFGAQAVVVAIDARRDPDAADPVRDAQVYVQGGRRPIGRTVVEWAREAEQRGAGEILLTSMDSDGTRAGFDCELTAAVSEAVRHSRDCLGRRRNRRALCRCVCARQSRCCARGQHLSFRCFHFPLAQRRTRARGRSGEAAMLIPSIDLMGGRIVQLVQGEKLRLAFDDFEYWIEKFSRFPLVQLIDLDAAMRQGDNSALVEQIAKRLPVQAGGGIHTIDRARQVLDAGAKRVIIGSALFSAEGAVNTSFAAELAASRRRRPHRRRHRHQKRPHRREGLEGAGCAHARRRDSAA